jgi:hypothetical protein
MEKSKNLEYLNIEDLKKKCWLMLILTTVEWQKSKVGVL